MSTSSFCGTFQISPLVTRWLITLYNETLVFNPKGYKCGDKCDGNSDLHHVSENNVQYCDSDWDSFLCWIATPAGQELSQPCPPFSHVVIANANATRECQQNGTWRNTDYKACMHENFPPHILDSYTYSNQLAGVRIVYAIGYSLTILALIVALAIFGYFRSLRCLRNIIHCNLLCAFLLNSIAWLFLHSAVTKLLHAHPNLCSGMAIVVHHLHSIPFYWMFIEGLYLFTIIVWAFSAAKIRLWYYLLLGWGVPVIPTVVWAVVKLHYANKDCLLDDTDYDYIIYGPVLLLLALNVFFITAIIWVLVTKLRASNTLETRQSRKATKATVVLFPLLGVTYIFFLKTPIQSKGVHATFNYVNAILQSFQGLFVAIIYCFLNGEVRSLVRLKLSALQDSRTLSRYTRSSFFGSPRRSSCYAMATTTCNGGRNAPGPGGATVGTISTAISGSSTNLASLGEGSNRRGDRGEESTVMVVCGDAGDGWASSSYSNSNSNGNAEVKGKEGGKVMYLADGETEASEAMIENML
ncbi:hypothetical protein EGW08_020171 [Elysia chlorotica]|uniref:G-protein coupled receptors family 2 profile 2 domain-containing protein n=1 Tax=Elysia chlorotica TaxID=188477 RepID=A0A433SS56_ELYCH|nr:hypothetical protein EGW08_020171 [Elysia chlorotica]